VTYEPTDEDIEAVAEVLHDNQKDVGRLYLRWAERPEGEGPWAGWRDQYRDEARALLGSAPMQQVIISAIRAHTEKRWKVEGALMRARLDAQNKRDRERDRQDPTKS
jgi:hypothetical protein